MSSQVGGHSEFDSVAWAVLCNEHVAIASSLKMDPDMDADSLRKLEQSGRLKRFRLNVVCADLAGRISDVLAGREEATSKLDENVDADSELSKHPRILRYRRELENAKE